MLMDTLLVIDEILCVGSIFALAFFCAVVPKTNIAKYLYIVFGLTLLPMGVKFIQDGKPWYQCIWVFLFAAVGIIVGIVLIRINKEMSDEDRKDFDRSFGKEARQGGIRRLPKHINKMK